MLQSTSIHELDPPLLPAGTTVRREMDYAVFPITIHPDVAGKPQVLLMLERLYQHMSERRGASCRSWTSRRISRDGCTAGSSRCAVCAAFSTAVGDGWTRPRLST